MLEIVAKLVIRDIFLRNKIFSLVGMMFVTVGTILCRRSNLVTNLKEVRTFLTGLIEENKIKIQIIYLGENYE